MALSPGADAFCSEKHSPFSDGESEDDTLLSDGLDSRTSSGRDLSRNHIVVYVAVAVSWLLSLFLVFHFTQSALKNKSSYETGFDTDLEPLKQAIEMERIRFTGGLNIDDNGTLYLVTEPGATQYVGNPTPEIDAAWDALLQVDGVDLIGDEATSIEGKTMQKPVGGWWLVGVDGFHQIHCLRMLYKGIHRDYYVPKDPPEVFAIHLDHCVDYLRQALMCQVDISPIYVEWSDRWNRMFPKFGTEHTCRNFQKIQDWMKPRNGLDHRPPG
ncbi:hypothetical protein F4678DRAFT_426840, partial [Xylaria arbuscula]